MKVAVFSSKPYDDRYLTQANHDYHHDLQFFENHLNEKTVQLAAGFPAICIFTNDVLNRNVLEALSKQGTCLAALRCAGYNNVDLAAAKELGLTVVRVPAYSPYSVAEHTIGMILALNRKFHKAYNRVREGNFNIDGLLGFDLATKTVGVVGTGHIGARVITILRKGFGCEVLAYDPYPSLSQVEHDFRYVELPELLQKADIITLHCPLTSKTRHLIDESAIDQMKKGIMLINSSRGAVVDAQALIQGLKTGKIGYLGLDVYEEETEIFFEDWSATGITDDTLARLLTFPNVLITSHQAFFTEEAMLNIANTTLANISEMEQGLCCGNQVTLGNAG